MLSQHTRYALKALIYLGEQGPAFPRPISEVATATKVSRKFLEAILVNLKHKGFVTSTRGKSGGYVLAKPTTAISFADVIRATDGPLALVRCASKNFYQPCADCPDEMVCALNRVMVRARDSLNGVLEQTTIADAMARADRSDDLDASLGAA